MELSQLKFYSVGVVAANKKLSSKLIEVTPMEDLPFADGEITDNSVKYKSDSQDAEGKSYSVAVDSTVTVKAEWLPLGQSNRMTAPDVRRGETVMLYRFADADKFYWTTLRNDTRLRRLETVIYAFNAIQTEDVDGNADNMYWLEVSTHQKLVHFHTSKANGEPFAYDIQINTKDGCIVIKDDVGNYFSFDSKAHRLEMMNQDGSHLDIDKTKIFLKSTDLIQMDSKTINLNGETINEKSTTQNITASTLNIKATTNHTGTISSTGAITSQADVKAGSISLQSHKHKDGGGTGPSGTPI
jgi:hypothetical protein